jgi:hypothetical protein
VLTVSLFFLRHAEDTMPPLAFARRATGTPCSSTLQNPDCQTIANRWSASKATARFHPVRRVRLVRSSLSI